MNVRRHLFEFEDLPRFPAVLRAGMVDYLAAMSTRLDLYRPVVPLLREALEATGQPNILELCAGSGGATGAVLAHLRAAGLPTLRVTLTDLYPQVSAWRALAERTPGLQFETQPVDATAVPPELTGFRVIFSAFHHFPPPVAQAILADAVRQRVGIAVIEGAGKRWHELALVWTVLPLAQLLVTPTIRPFRWSRLLFTYLVPLIPLFTLWDGTVSLLRMYPPDHLRRLARQADPTGAYRWQSDRIRHRWGPELTYLIGTPRSLESGKSDLRREPIMRGLTASGSSHLCVRWNRSSADRVKPTPLCLESDRFVTVGDRQSLGLLDMKTHRPVCSIRAGFAAFDALMIVLSVLISGCKPEQEAPIKKGVDTLCVVVLSQNWCTDECTEFHLGLHSNGLVNIRELRDADVILDSSFSIPRQSVDQVSAFARSINYFRPGDTYEYHDKSDMWFCVPWYTVTDAAVTDILIRDESADSINVKGISIYQAHVADDTMRVSCENRERYGQYLDLRKMILNKIFDGKPPSKYGDYDRNSEDWLLEF